MKKNRDKYYPDGVLDYGQRLVRKGGVIKFDNAKWQDDRLVPLVGQTVGVMSPYYWVTSICVYLPSYPKGKHFVTVRNQIK